mgnify:CR=1 FL=1
MKGKNHMTVKQKELCNIIEELPDELSNKVLDYIEYLKYTMTINSAHQDVIVKDKKDLRKKILEGIKDTEKGKTCTIDEAFREIEEIIK